jgi:hypothetical protein
VRFLSVQQSADSIIARLTEKFEESVSNPSLDKVLVPLKRKADTDTDTPRGPAKKQKTAMMGHGDQGKAPQRPKKGAKRGGTQKRKK